MGKTKTTKPATSRKKVAKAAPASEKVTETSTEAAVAEFPPYDEEAWGWMSNESIPGAYCPILYTGTDVSIKISKLLGRPMTLKEAQHLVQADGEEATCASEGKVFQPVKYVPFLPQDLEARLSNGESLTEVDLPYGGSYYVSKDNETIAISGCVFHARDGKYEWNHKSPLVITAQEMGKRHGKMMWGVPLNMAQQIIESRTANNERRKKISAFVANLLPTRKGLGRGADGFDKADRNGKHPHATKMKIKY